MRAWREAWDRPLLDNKASIMNKTLTLFLSAFLCAAFIHGSEYPVLDETNPLLPSADWEAAEAPIPAATGFSTLFEDASLTLRSTYYGRARSADNRNRYDGAGNPVGKHTNEIHVNSFGQGVDLRSGYAWGILGFDVSGHTNLGRGNGWSEVLYHRERGNEDRSSLTLGQAALKTRLAAGDFAFEARGGFTPISIGSLGTSGGLHPHAYRGFETKVKYKDFTLGYGWADQFKNEWDDHYRDMFNKWHQNRFGNDDGRRIRYVHSLGMRYEWGENKDGFADIGVGEGRRYRKNAQAVISAPFDLSFGTLTLTGYGIVAKYQDLYSDRKKATEYHVSGSAKLKTGLWTFATGLGHTRAPDSEEMQFRLTAWGNSDNRNYIQTWGQLDDFVWDGQNVVKAEVGYELGKKVRLPGLSVGARYLYTWNGVNPNRIAKSAGWELDYNVEYQVQKGALKGLSLGVYAGHLRWANNKFHGKQNRNDVKVIMSYSKTLESFLRRRK